MSFNEKTDVTMIICIFSCETTTAQHVFSRIFLCCHRQREKHIQCLPYLLRLVLIWPKTSASAWSKARKAWRPSRSKPQRGGTWGGLETVKNEHGHPAKPQIVVVLLSEGRRSQKLLPKNMDYDWVAWWWEHVLVALIVADFVRLAQRQQVQSIPEFFGVCLTHRGEGSNLVQTWLVISAALKRSDAAGRNREEKISKEMRRDRETPENVTVRESCVKMRMQSQKANEWNPFQSSSICQVAIQCRWLKLHVLVWSAKR